MCSSWRLGLAVCTVVVQVGCATTNPKSLGGSPKAVVQGLMPVPGHYQTYTKVSEIEMIKSALTSELYSTLKDWATWLAKAKAATPPTAYAVQMMLPGSDNVFFGQSVVDGNPLLSETITGINATVSLNTMLYDTDGKSVLRKSKITFFLVQQDGGWRVRDVNREDVSFPEKKPFRYDLLDALKSDIVRFKAAARKS